VPASIGKESGLIDLFHFSKSRSHRFVKKIGERFLRRRWAYLPDPRDPEFIPRIRGTPAFRSAVQDLKDAGFLHPSLSIRGIRNSEVGRILTLGMLVRHINP
jgi:hypothetical protein